MGWTGFQEEALLELKDQNETAVGTGPTFLMRETAWTKALRQEGGKHLGKTTVTEAQKAEDGMK